MQVGWPSKGSSLQALAGKTAAVGGGVRDQKQTSAHVRVMSALPPKANIGGCNRDVR